MTHALPLVTARHDHLGLVVQDLAAQAAWYRATFGLVETTGHQPTADIRTAVLRAPNGLQLELVQNAKSRREHLFKDAMEATFVQGYGHWAVEVDDLGQAYGALMGVGATMGRAPADGPDGSRFAYIKDPEGNLIELIQPRTDRP